MLGCTIVISAGKYATSVSVVLLAILVGWILTFYLPTAITDFPTTSFRTVSSCRKIDMDDLHSIELKHLLLLKYRNEKGDQELRIIKEVAGQWTKLCISLDCNVNRIIKSAGHLADERCQLVLEEWLDSGGTEDYPTSWSGLIKVLTDIEEIRLAKTLDDALKQCVY